MIKAAPGGVSVRQAAACYGIGISTNVRWVRRAQSGKVTASRQDQPRGSKPDPHAALRLEQIEASSHISLHEMQVKLREERGVSASIGPLWRFFDVRAITVKVPRTPASATGPTSKQRESPGLSGSLISTRNGRCSSARPVPQPKWPACMDVAREGNACGSAFRMGTGRPRPL